jgi:hypothetical protein
VNVAQSHAGFKLSLHGEKQHLTTSEITWPWVFHTDANHENESNVKRGVGTKGDNPRLQLTVPSQLGDLLVQLTLFQHAMLALSPVPEMTSCLPV